MAGVSARIDVTTDELRPVLAGLIAAGEDLSPAMDAIGVEMVASTLDRFEREAGPDGTPWQKSARAEADGGKTLTHYGHLRGSLTHLFGPDSTEWGSNLIYAAIHQEGGTITASSADALRFQLPDGGFATVQSVTMPARPYLGLDDGDEADILDILADHFGDAAVGGRMH
ncbi:phage virion morphogenesis protein [Marivibrio halodurans]|uniref:Phage virion morphogenesis protein n=1 Tax=Marivibrio halodurans TaxID=2039722 RepID=A0A8J7V2L4_9PROT|nr:phage virion morphogenesis protein [Marivibrio halodurans]MBP5857291.1 phage virion morphogenesis protein [Marivibrio halodurans]